MHAHTATPTAAKPTHFLTQYYTIITIYEDVMEETEKHTSLLTELKEHSTKALFVLCDLFVSLLCWVMSAFSVTLTTFSLQYIFLWQ